MILESIDKGKLQIAIVKMVAGVEVQTQELLFIYTLVPAPVSSQQKAGADNPAGEGNNSAQNKFEFGHLGTQAGQ